MIILYRAIAATLDADNQAQFVHLVSTVNVVSENQAQLGHEVKAIKAKDHLRDCKDHEEKEGRLNYDMLNRFIVIGGPYIDPGINQQQALQSQVTIVSVNVLSQPSRPYLNITNSLTSLSRSCFYFVTYNVSCLYGRAY
jgi:hypothetical protein